MTEDAKDRPSASEQMIAYTDLVIERNRYREALVRIEERIRAVHPVPYHLLRTLIEDVLRDVATGLNRKQASQPGEEA